jgi:hypothetical protein
MEEGGRIGVVGWAMKPEMTAQLVIIPASRDVCFRVEAKFASMADMRRRKAVVHVAADVSRLWVSERTRSREGAGFEACGLSAAPVRL